MFLKIFLFCKRPLHSFGQRVPKCTPISGLFLKNFFKKKFTLHLFGITKPNDTLFHRKMRNIFFGCRCFILLAKKSPFTHSHWERPNAHHKSQKIFYPYTYLELRSRNAPCFYKNFEKYFFDWGPWFCLLKKSLHLFGIRRLKRNLFFKKTEKFFWKNCLSQKHPLTCSHWERAFGDSNPEKRQKNLPAGYGGRFCVCMAARL